MLSSSQRFNGGRPQAIDAIQGAGEMAHRIRTHEWEETQLGPLDRWPPELLTIVNMMLASREIATVFWGPDRLMIYNDQYTSQLGIRHPASLGLPLREVWPEVVNQVKHLLDPVFDSGCSTYVEDAPLTVIENGIDTQRIYPISCEPIWIRADSGSTVQGVYQTAINNTAKLQAERERERLASQMEQILAASTDGVAILGRDWTFTYMNRRGREVVQPLGDIVGKNAWEAFPGMLFENSPYVYHYHRAMDQGIEGSFVTEYPEPLNITIQVFVRPIVDGILVTFRDITEQRLATAALLESEKLAAVGRLASTIAHEINNPLESVTNLLYLASRSENTDEIHEYLDTAERELRRVSVISNQTLRFNKQLTGASVVSCTHLFTEALSIYQGRLVNSHITVEKRKRAKRSTECIEGEVRQVLSNFLSNAIDAMSSSGGRLILRSREATRWKTGQQGLVLTVADTGPGIPLDKQKRIFDAFYSTKGMAGTGLGLWISKEIAERHLGAINFRSSTRKGKSGTVFSLFLPFQAAPR